MEPQGTFEAGFYGHLQVVTVTKSNLKEPAPKTEHSSLTVASPPLTGPPMRFCQRLETQTFAGLWTLAQAYLTHPVLGLLIQPEAPLH